MIMNRLAIGLTLLLFCVLTGCAQETDDVRFSAHYMAQFKNYKEANGEMTEEKVLEVGDRRSCFYGRWQHRREEITDSIVAAGGLTGELLSKIAEYPSPRQFYAVYDNYPSVGKRTVTDRVLKSFHYEEDIDDIQWTLLDRERPYWTIPARWRYATTETISGRHAMPRKFPFRWDPGNFAACRGL